MNVITVRLLGVEQPLVYDCDELDELWDILQDGDWVSFTTTTGDTVQLRSSYATCVQGSWDVERELSATDCILVWLVGEKTPLRLTFGGDAEEWPRPTEALQEQDWIGWRDANLQPVMLQTQHMQAMVYPTRLDEEAEKPRPRRKKKAK